MHPVSYCSEDMNTFHGYVIKKADNVQEYLLRKDGDIIWVSKKKDAELFNTLESAYEAVSKS